MKTNQSHLSYLILFLIISTYSLLILSSSFDFFAKDISAENILFKGEFIKWLESSVVASGRFVPFSNTFNILLFNITDNLIYFIFLKVIIIFLNFLILKKIFDHLKINKYFIFAIIGICYNHAFLNGQYITAFEGDLSLLISILFYIDLKRSNRKTTTYEYFLVVFLMLFLLGLKESMFGFLFIYTFLKILFYKNDNLLMKFSYIIILTIYLFLYYNFVFAGSDLNNIYGSQNNENSKLFNLSKISLNYIICFPVLSFIMIIISNDLIKNSFAKKIKSLSIKNIYFISSFGYIGVYIVFDLFAFRYVLPLYFILLPIFFLIYEKLDKKKPIKIFIIITFIFGPVYSNSIGLINNYFSKNYNRALNNKLDNLIKVKKIAVISNFDSKLEYLLEGQKHDRNDYGNILNYFENNNNLVINNYSLNKKNINKDFLNNEVIISLIENDYELNEKLIKLVDDKIYHNFSLIRVCHEPILIKSLLNPANCRNLLTNVFTKHEKNL